MGSWLVIPVLLAVNRGGKGKEWVAENIDEGHLEYYFFLLACLMALDMVSRFISICIMYESTLQIFFQYISHGYDYKRPSEFGSVELSQNPALMINDSINNNDL